MGQHHGTLDEGVDVAPAADPYPSSIRHHGRGRTRLVLGVFKLAGHKQGRRDNVPEALPLTPVQSGHANNQSTNCWMSVARIRCFIQAKLIQQGDDVGDVPV